MTLSTRRALVVAALFTIAGCGGTTGQNSLAPSGTTSSAVSRLTVPTGAFFPVPYHAPVQRSIHATYTTKKSLLFETDFSSRTVNIFLTTQLSTGDPSPIATITEPTGGCPYDMALDKKKTLYLADQCLNQVEEYSKGSTTMKTAITEGLTAPTGLAIDKNGTLYVSLVETGEVQEFANGSTTPTKTVTGMSDPFGISLDSKGNLYIPDFGCGCVWELPAGGSSVTNLGLQDLTEPLQSSVDEKTGYLWVTDGSGNRVQVYQLGSTTPVETIAGAGFPYTVSVQNGGGRKGETVYGDEGNSDVYVFEPNQYTPFATVTDAGEPTGSLLVKL
jgi:DNA-binding beta-propeller fold protein YncE